MSIERHIESVRRVIDLLELESVAATKPLRGFDMRHVEQLPEIHARIDVPVRLMCGDQDPLLPVDRAEAIVDTFPDASIEILEGVGLFSHEEAPADVSRALLPRPRRCPDVGS